MSDLEITPQGVTRREKCETQVSILSNSMRGERRSGKLACRYDRAEAADAVGVNLAISIKPGGQKLKRSETFVSSR
jgi:hypothetical protein